MAPLLVVSLGLTVVLVMGDFDLSVGSMLGLSGAVIIVLMINEGWPWVPAVLVAAALALGVGIFNGILIAYAGTPSFITTLAMGTTLVGIEFVVTGQRTIVGFGGLPEVYRWLAIGKPVFGINFQVWIALGLAILVYLVLDQTEMGRYMYAVGGNPEAARLSGIRVRRLRVVGFVVVALFATVAGVLVTGSNASTSPNTGIPFLLPAYAAVFLGAAVFRNGQFNVPGTLVGVLFLQIIATGLTMMQFSTAIVNVVQGSVLIAAMLLSRLGQVSSP
jgi:ribose transport system permease protein